MGIWTLPPHAPTTVRKGSFTLPKEAGVAQLAEQLFCKQQVTGSIPVAGSIENLGRSAGFQRSLYGFDPAGSMEELRWTLKKERD